MPRHMLKERLQTTKFTYQEQTLENKSHWTGMKLVAWYGQFQLSPTICS